MAYMVRLGLWGPGSPFPDGFEEFKIAVERGGVGMMELVAMHMKRTGTYICRTLSFEGCSFEIVEDAIAREHLDLYDKAAKLWQQLFVDLKNSLHDERYSFFPTKKDKKGELDEDLDELDDSFEDSEVRRINKGRSPFRIILYILCNEF